MEDGAGRFAIFYSPFSIIAFPFAPQVNQAHTPSSNRLKTPSVFSTVIRTVVILGQREAVSIAASSTSTGTIRNCDARQQIVHQHVGQ